MEIGIVLVNGIAWISLKLSKQQRDSWTSEIFFSIKYCKNNCPTLILSVASLSRKLLLGGRGVSVNSIPCYCINNL
jgi:hypothetical protein